MYALCERGHQNSSDEVPKDLTRVEILKLLLLGRASDVGGKDEDAAQQKRLAPVGGRAALYEWLDRVHELVGEAKALRYTALHWLAVHDDYRAIHFLLSTVKPNDPAVFLRLFDETYNGESPLDLAG